MNFISSAKESIQIFQWWKHYITPKGFLNEKSHNNMRGTSFFFSPRGHKPILCVTQSNDF
jgi:hypothetical protein